MKRKYLRSVLLLVILGGSAFFLTGCTSEDDSESDSSKVKIIDLNDDEEEEDNTGEDEDTTDDISEDDSSSDSDETADYSNFSRDQQVVGTEDGEDEESEYTLLSLTDEELSGFHRFVFTVEAKEGVTKLPYIVVEYKSSLGSIRVDLNGFTTDNSGIAYQGFRSINKEGVTRIYHNISSDQTEELYDMGVSESTPFYLHYEEVSAGKWNIILDVKYPGESDLEFDLGSSEFSTEEQNISGSVADDGAAVTGYSYSVSGGQLVFIWTVTGSSSKPIPSVSAELGDDGILDVKFQSLSYDKVSGVADDIELPGQIGLTYSDGAYHFEVSSDDEFKLSASTSPNQVELTIKL